MRMLQVSSKIPGPDFKDTLRTSLKTFTAEPFGIYLELNRKQLLTFLPVTEFYKYAIEFQSNFQDIAKVWFGPKLLIFLYHPADIEVKGFILKTKKNLFSFLLQLILSSNVHIDKSAEYSVFKPWFGNGLLISTGAKWKHHRKMIAPTFHQSILKTFVPKFYENSLKVCEKMKREKGKNFDCHDYMSGTTVDILLETAMGYNAPRTEETGYNYAMAVMKYKNLIS